jgi:hypothetical protein
MAEQEPVTPVTGMEESHDVKEPEQVAAQSAVTQEVHNECKVCSEKDQNISFEPCGHQVACEECAARMKRCLDCHQPIVRQVAKGQ